MRRLVFWAAATFGYAALAVAYFWPLPLRLATGIGHDNGDPLLNTWILSWTAEHLPLTADWWNAPAFAPMPHSLALSEHLLGLWPLSAPLLWVGLPPLVVYNLLLMASLVFCGLAATALATHLTGSRSAGVVAGCLFALAPYRLEQLAHLQILANWWGPVALLALHRQVETGGWRWASLFAVSWLLLALTSGYHLLFFTVVAAMAGLWLFGRAVLWRRAVPLVVATACTAVVLVPTLRMYTRAHDEQGLTRQPAEIDEYSADVLHLGTRPYLSRVWGRPQPDPYGEISLFPGVALVAGTLLAIATAWWRRRAWSDTDDPPDIETNAWPAWPARVAGCLAAVPATLALIAAVAPGERVVAGIRFSLSTPAKSLTIAWLLGAIALVLSRPGQRLLARRGPLPLYALIALATWLLTLGPRARVGGVAVMYHAPYAWLMALPGGLAMRVPPRFWLWTVLALAVVTAFGVARLRRGAPRAGLVAAGLLVAAAAADGWPRVMPVVDSPGALPWPSSPGSARVVELPLGEASRDVAAMWRGRAHGHPVVNGYSGYDPFHYQVLKRAFHDLDPAVLGVLAEPGALTVAVDTAADGATELTAMVAAAGATPAAGDTGRWRFATLPARQAPRPQAGQRHVPSRVITIDGEDVTAATTDADPYSRWTTGGPQREGQGLVADVGATVAATALELGLGAYAVDYPARLVVEARVGDRWEVVHDGPTSAAALRATVAAPTDPRLVIPLLPSRASTWRITTRAGHAKYHWSVSSLVLIEGPSSASH